MVVSVDLPDAVLRLLGLNEDSPVSAVKARLENLAKVPCLDIVTKAGVVRVGFQDIDSEEVVAFANVKPSIDDSQWLPLFEASVADCADGNIDLEMFGDPFIPEYTHLATLRRSDVERAVK